MAKWLDEKFILDKEYRWLNHIEVIFVIYCMNKTFNYSFVTIWKIKAPIEKVWDCIHEAEEWPKWWKGVKRVETISQGDANDIGKMMHYSWRSTLPYTLSFDVVSTKLEKPYVLEGDAIGELEGEGKWQLSYNIGITTVQYNWNVNTTKKWMKILAPLLRPLFKWNHNVVMRWGAEGLAKKLDADLVKY